MKDNFEKMKDSEYSEGSELKKYFDLLPDYSVLKKNFMNLMDGDATREEMQIWLHKNLVASVSIDVNIMTKLDRTTYLRKEPLPAVYNDGHSALRGFANSV